MRKSVKDLIQKTILFQYKLPNNVVTKSKFSNQDDYCYAASNNDNLSEVIYNAVIEYAFNQNEISEQDFDILHRRALTRKLKFNDGASEEQKLKYGFYGEIVLYCLLYMYYQAPPIIARGHLYNILENGETKGYDAYHLIDNQKQTELWFGEVKFYQNFSAASTGKNGAITNLEKVITDDYLNTNLIAISERTNDLAIKESSLKPILEDIKNNPDIQISELSKKYDIKIVYPMLILFDEDKDGYDQTIQKAIQHIEENAKEIVLNISIEVSLFFILLPVNSSKAIKSKVIQWIEDKKQLMS